MKEELVTRVVTKRPATKPGCCMWSPVLPLDRSSDTKGVAASTSSVGAGSDKARIDTPPSDALAEIALES